MNGVLLQVNRLSAVQRAVRDQFTRGGSLTAIAVILVGLVGVIALTYFLARRQRRNDRSVRRFDPQLLFETLLRKLYLSVEQRRWLGGVARGAKLEHPAVLVLSEALFDRYAAEWASQQPHTPGTVGTSDAMSAKVRGLLFPKSVFKKPLSEPRP